LHYQLLHKNEPIKILEKDYQEPQTIPLLNRVIEEEIKIAGMQQSATVEAEQKDKSSHLEDKIEALKPFSFHIPTMEVVKDVMDNIKEKEEPVELPREMDAQEEVVDNATENSITSFALEATQDYMYAVPKETSKIQQAVAADEEIMIGETEAEQETAAAIKATAEEKETAEEENLSELTAEDELVANDKLASLLNQQLEDFKKPVTEETKLPIESEPYHTVDYFASQGIRPNADNGSQDKLSIQLRRFTDWLKMMKHAETEPKDLGTDPELETAIQGIAQTSNEARDVVTETMAEVLEKQGKKDRAIQLYIKLSFLNPDKSAYFAAKIQQLKGI
jgi:hypothetical protein